MEPVHLAVIAEKGFIRMIRRFVPRDEGLHVTLHDGFGHECIDLARKLQSDGVDAIITGPTNRALLRDRAEVPVLTFRATYADLFVAIKRGLTYGSKMALVNNSLEDWEMTDLGLVGELIGIELATVSFHKATVEGLEDCIAGLRAKGTQVVIGAGLTCRIARRHGMRSIVIYTLPNAMQDAVYRAVEVVKVRRREEERTQQLRTILDFAHEGIISADEHGLINLCNASALKLLDLRSQDVIGHPLTELFANTHVITTLSPDLGSVATVRNATLVTNHIPVKVRRKMVSFVTTFQDITRVQELETAIRLATEGKGMTAKVSFDQIIGQSAAMQGVVKAAKTFALSASTVLLEAETGTGKEMFAQSIHNFSPRYSRPFVAINCSALPENLLESELFGYEDGAFTGARKAGKKGLFELAHNGSIFLDEVSSVSIGFQAKLLRVLQEREIMRIGSDKVIPVNVRVIAAANEELSAAVAAGRFRADLYFRLNVLTLQIPPLRQRQEDMPALVLQFVREIGPALYEELRKWIDYLVQPLLLHRFPGNVRELRSMVERFVILVDRTRLTEGEYLVGMMRSCLGQTAPDPTMTLAFKGSLRSSLETLERQLIQRTLHDTRGDKSEAAAQLGVSRATLYRRLEVLGIT